MPTSANIPLSVWVVKLKLHLFVPRMWVIKLIHLVLGERRTRTIRKIYLLISRQRGVGRPDTAVIKLLHLVRGNNDKADKQKAWRKAA